MKEILLAVLLCGCLQIQFDQPLNAELDGFYQGEVQYQQTFSCNIDVKLAGELQNGTAELEISDGISHLADKKYASGPISFSSNYQRAAPIAVTLTLQDFNGTLDFSVKCS